MLLLVLAGLLAAPPKAPAPAPQPPAPAPVVSASECAALAEHGFALYLANLKNDEGIRYETRELSREQARAYVKEVERALLEDRTRHLTEAAARCRERAARGDGTRRQYECAMAATTFPAVEKCLGLKLSGEAL